MALKHKLRRIASVAVRKFLSRRGLELRKIEARNGPDLPLLRILVDHLRQPDVNAVIQIGANDGVRNDPIHQIVLDLQLPALLVEPLPYMFRELQNNYAVVSHVRTANVAVGRKSGNFTLYHVPDPPPGSPPWIMGVATFDRKRLMLSAGVVKGLEHYVKEISVPLVTMRQLLDNNPGFEPVFLLQVDTEGYDLEVIQSALEAGLRPRIINYEHKLLSFRQQELCRTQLAELGYRFASFNGSDTIAVLMPD